MTETIMLNRIKVALAERQKTSKWLAEQLNKSETTVSRWASNKVQPSIEQLFEIAQLLNMDAKELLNTTSAL
jgi:transcriptional regulator with XRE-family HTH domain